jgi:hypothetical protein
METSGHVNVKQIDPQTVKGEMFYRRREDIHRWWWSIYSRSARNSPIPIHHRFNLSKNEVLNCIPRRLRCPLLSNPRGTKPHSNPCDLPLWALCIHSWKPNLFLKNIARRWRVGKHTLKWMKLPITFNNRTSPGPEMWARPLFIAMPTLNCFGD